MAERRKAPAPEICTGEAKRTREAVLSGCALKKVLSVHHHAVSLGCGILPRQLCNPDTHLSLAPTSLIVGLSLHGFLLGSYFPLIQ